MSEGHTNSSSAKADQPVDTHMVEASTVGTTQADLVLTAGGTSRRIFKLREGRTIIGRDGRCDVRIPLPKVSSEHCEIMLENQRATLLSHDEDLGTLLNGRVVRHAPLSHDDEVTVGPVTFRVVLQQPDQA